MARSSQCHSTPCPVCREASIPREVGRVRLRPQQRLGHLGGEALAGSRWMGGPVPGCYTPGGGQSHDLLLGLPTCCLLRRPLPGPAPGSGCLGAQPMQGEGGGLMCHLPAHLASEALSSHPQPDLCQLEPLVAVRPLGPSGNLTEPLLPYL